MSKLSISAAKRNRITIMAAGVILIVCAVWAALLPAAKDKDADARADLLAHDTAVLWEWADQVYAGGAGEAEWTVRWDIEDDKGVLTLEKLTRLAEARNGNNTGKLFAGPGDRITVSVMEGTAELSIQALTEPQAAGEGGGGRYMALLQTTPASEKDALIAVLEQMADGLSDLGVSYNGTVSARGTAAGERAADKLAALAQAREVERYEDGGTKSVTYYTPKLLASVGAGEGKAVNLQAALHERTDTESVDLTVGSPLITGDYSAAEQP